MKPRQSARRPSWARRATRVWSGFAHRSLRLACIVCLGLSAGAPGCASSPEVAPRATPASAAPVPVQPKVFLWTAQVGASTLHLLGSVHVARRDLYPLDPRIDAAFSESDVLVLELALDEESKLQAAQRMLELGRLPDGVRLKDVLEPATWQLLEQTEARRGVSLFGLRGFRPWFAALALTTQALESAGFSADEGIDEHFRRRATGNKSIVALETVEQQLALFTGLTPKDEEQMLEQTLREMDQYGSQLEAAFDAWKAGDAAALDSLLIGPMRSEYPALFEQLFLDRNRRMVDALLGMMAQRAARYFVVVGAGHLVGQSGIVDLLRRQGIVAAQP
jgi:uncharacterized protein YbaP (TraB family)